MELASALRKCSIPLYSASESSLFSSVSRTGRLTMTNDHSSTDSQMESELAAYKRSNEYDDYGSDDSISNRRNSNTRSYSSSISDGSSDDNDAGSNKKNSRSYSSRGKSNSENGNSGSNSQSKNRTNDSKYDRNTNSTDSRKKTDVKIPYDDNSNYRPEGTEMRDGYSGNNNRFSSKGNSNRTKDFQRAMERGKRSLRISREIYNTGGDSVSACTIQCILSRIQVVDERGFPTEHALVTFIKESIDTEQQRITAIRDVRDCFKKLRSDVEEDNCVRSKKLTDCMGLVFTKPTVNVTGRARTSE